MATLENKQVVDLALGVIIAESRAVRTTLDSADAAFVHVARLLASCSGNSVVTGSGMSGALANWAAHLLSVCGAPTFCLTPPDGLHGALGALQSSDIRLGLPKRGSSSERKRIA